jgi:hypothetical protein
MANYANESPVRAVLETDALLEGPISLQIHGSSFVAHLHNNLPESLISINGKSYLQVDHATNLRKGTSISRLRDTVK